MICERFPDMANDAIMKLRFWALVIVRTIALGMLVYGAVCLLLGFGIGIANYSGVKGLYHGLFLVHGSDLWSWLWFGVALMVVGGVVMALSRRIVRWLIAAPMQECARCGYEMAHLGSPKCPECGFQIGSG
jgi:hypothetical protein